MLRIGITGGIGSGKSIVCRIFETLGIPVFYADDQAKSIMTIDPILIDAIKQIFGERSYFNDGTLNRKYLADIVFNDKMQLDHLNNLVHPAVQRAFENWQSQLPKNLPYCLKEAALLFESGSYQQCDYTLMVCAPLQLRIDRVKKRDGLSEEQVLARMEKQWSDEKKSAYADYFIQNDGQHSLIQHVWDFHQRWSKGIN